MGLDKIHWLNYSEAKLHICDKRYFIHTQSQFVLRSKWKAVCSRLAIMITAANLTSGSRQISAMSAALESYCKFTFQRLKSCTARSLWIFGANLPNLPSILHCMSMKICSLRISVNVNKNAIFSTLPLLPFEANVNWIDL